MAFQCPNCSRKLTDTTDPADPPMFCMYCGYRLRESSVPVVAVGQQPELSDSQTHAFVARPEITNTAVPDQATATTPEATPAMVAGYQLVRMLGAGGMGQVYEAAHPGGQRVAIKLLSRRLAASSASVERFRQEGRVASQITHPHCVFVLRADTDAGRPYIMMELMPGRTLKDLVDDEGPLKVPDAIGRILDVIEGLAEAHELGVIHRDVKPSNCFLTADNRVKVGDFGLSKSLSSEQPNQQLTHSGAFLGTVLFASPEQIRGEPVSYDSDVYAVCATLYYLLLGRAPFQHESLTASLAKAVSEPPPPIRPKRPEVPLELERIILKGLDRDRQKRYATLDELKRALEDVQPERQQPARPRSLVLAYLMDCAFILLATIPVELLRTTVIGMHTSFNLTALSWPTTLVTQIYFTLFEGLLGWTPGKRLLRMRVSKLGQTGPPGLMAGFIRAGVFNLLWCSIYYFPEWSIEYWPRGAAGGLLALGFILLAAIGLLSQFKKTAWGWRGLHDRLSGCRVTSRAFTNPPRSLESLYPSEVWERVQPSPVPLPSEVSGFAVTHKLSDLPDGGMVWHAEDRSLARRVLLHILPIGMDDPIRGETPLVRPHRLRIIGHGMFIWDGSPRVWIAYVAPAGVPLADCVSANCTLNWPDTRALLEQLALELESAQQEDRLPTPLSVDQVWVEPNGRLQLLDFPLKGVAPAQDSPPNDNPLSLLRAVTTLALEGRARDTSDQVKAPISPRAMNLTSELLQHDELTLAEVRSKLTEDHQHPTVMTTGLRAGHIAVQSVLLFIGLFQMFLAGGMLSFIIALTASQQISQPKLILAVLENPTEAAKLVEQVKLYNKSRASDQQAMLKFLAPENRSATIQSLTEEVARHEEDLGQLQQTLITPERRILSQLQQVWTEVYATPEASEVNISLLNLMAMRQQGSRIDAARMRNVIGRSLLISMLVFPGIWIVFAFIFRGGIAYYLAGVTLVRRDGRKLGRLMCAVRELIVWLPLVLVLMFTLWLQTFHPTMAQTRFVMWLGALALMPIYVVIALRQPSQAPHDRLLGSRLVPV